MKRKRNQKKAPLTMKLIATIACGLYFYMIGNVMFGEPRETAVRANNAKIAQIANQALESDKQYGAHKSEETKPVILVKPAKDLKAPKKPVNRAEQEAMALLLYGTEEESKQAEEKLKRMNSMVVANKLMANK